MVMNEADVEERKGPAGLDTSVLSSARSEASGANDKGGIQESPWARWDDLVMNDLSLRGVLDAEYKTGVAFTKCPHAFHHDCLISYQTSEKHMNP